MKIVHICLVFIWLSYICSHVKAHAFLIPGSFTYYEEFAKEAVCYRYSKFLRDSSPELWRRRRRFAVRIDDYNVYIIGSI